MRRSAKRIIPVGSRAVDFNHLRKSALHASQTDHQSLRFSSIEVTIIFVCMGVKLCPLS
jgi:hypothetical protein